jgi:nitrite reductase/ring-hydroxylating ferredoxin subunit
MTSVTDNEILTRVGPGTPMGKLMREFWIPACMSSELAPDGDPMRLMLLGEKLIAFRDSSGRVGIMDHRCPHRCASLFFGRNEENGIRCAYHGWKFDVNGNCLDQPNLAPRYRFQQQVKAKAYQACERAGLVYVYMGTREVAPPFPQIEATLCEPEDAKIVLTQRDCNWLQNLEGDIDTSHFAFLHAGLVKAEDLDESDPGRFAVLEKTPEIHVKDTEFGTMYSASRPAEPGFRFHRFACFIFPFWVTYPGTELAHNVTANAWVPIDDAHTMVFNIGVKGQAGLGKGLRYKDGTPVPGLARPLEYLPRTDDWLGRWRPALNSSNDYGLDREVQKTWSFSGIAGVTMQDQGIIESMEPIVDRGLEHLAASDRMVIATRRALLSAARGLQDSDKVPALVDRPELCRNARGGDVVAPEERDWLVVYDEAMRAAQGPGRALHAAE